jgi:hypothetical protein
MVKRSYPSIPTPKMSPNKPILSADPSVHETNSIAISDPSEHRLLGLGTTSRSPVYSTGRECHGNLVWRGAAQPSWFGHGAGTLDVRVERVTVLEQHQYGINGIQPADSGNASTQTVTLTLTVTANDGCVNTDQVVVTVNATPDAGLTTTDPNPDLYVSPSGNSFALCGTGLATYDFQFSDASTAQPGATYQVQWGTPPAYNPPGGGWSQNHTYPVGLHTITYTITNPGPGSCANTATVDVFLGSNPSVGTSNPGNTLVCSGTNLTFPINNVAGNSPGTEYVITYGDGNGTSFPHPPPASVTYGYPNTNCPGAPYIFRIDAITPCPITSFATAGPIYITDTPQASFTQTADTACVNSSVTFTNTSLGVGGANCSQPLRVWTITPNTGFVVPAGMGALNGSNLPNQWTNGSNTISVQFTQPGTYCITLTVGNNLCGTDDVQHCVCIEAPPQPAFTLAPATVAHLSRVLSTTRAESQQLFTTYAWDMCPLRVVLVAAVRHGIMLEGRQHLRSNRNSK